MVSGRVKIGIKRIFICKQTMCWPALPVPCQPVPTDSQHAVDLSQGFLGVGPGGPGGPGGSEGVE